MNKCAGVTAGAFLIIALATLSGCTPSVTSIQDERDLNAMVAGQEVTVLFQDQRTAVVEDFHIDTHAASWTGGRVLRSEVMSVFYRPNPAPRAVTGFLGGLTIGALVGAVIGGRSMTGEDSRLGAGIGAALGGGAGGVIGLSIGLVTAPVVEYHVPRASPSGTE
jgi:hypothetical protein